MNEKDGFKHFLQKLNERLTLLFKIYIPDGQPPPERDRDLLEVLFRMYDDGRVEWLSKEPLEEKEVIQTDLFTTTLPPDEVADKEHESPKGTIIDKG